MKAKTLALLLLVPLSSHAQVNMHACGNKPLGTCFDDAVKQWHSGDAAQREKSRETFKLLCMMQGGEPCLYEKAKTEEELAKLKAASDQQMEEAGKRNREAMAAQRNDAPFETSQPNKSILTSVTDPKICSSLKVSDPIFGYTSISADGPKSPGEHVMVKATKAGTFWTDIGVQTGDEIAAVDDATSKNVIVTSLFAGHWRKLVIKRQGVAYTVNIHCQ